MISSTETILKNFNINQKIYFANAQHIEQALALHEQGNQIEPGISFYTKLYADLVDSSTKTGQAIAQKREVDPELLKAHRQLDAKLTSLSLRVAIASQKTPFRLSKSAKMGCYALAACVAAAAVYYFSKTLPTEETMKRVFDIGLGVKEEVLDTSRCTRTMGWNRDITRTCVTTRSTVNPDSLSQWLAGTKTCIDTIPSSQNDYHQWCPIPLWDPAEKSDLLRKGQEWIENEEWQNCSANNPRPAEEECGIPPQNSPFRTTQAKKAFAAYRILVDQHCKEHVCQRLDQSCNNNAKGGISCDYRVSYPFARAETQEELLETIWKQTPYPQTPERVHAIALENALSGERRGYRRSARDDAEYDQAQKEWNTRIEQQKCGPEIRTWENAYCVKTKCATETRKFFEKFYSLPLEFGRNFWSSFPAKIPELCPGSSCEISDYQIIDKAEALRMQLMGISPELIERFLNDNSCNRFPKS